MFCSEETDCIVLSKDVFNMIMGDYNDNILNEKV